MSLSLHTLLLAERTELPVLHAAVRIIVLK